MDGQLTIQRYEFLHPGQLAQYSRLISQVSNFASLAALVIDEGPSHYEESAFHVIEKLSPDIERLETDLSEWPGTMKVTSSNATRYVFRVNQHSIEVLAASARTLFDWHNRQLPEDLHFMRSDGSLVLGSIAHESYAWAELSAPERAAWGAEGLFELSVEGYNDLSDGHP
jgi:hypothetical protein